MKKRFGALIEEDTLRLAKQKAAKEGRPLSDLIQDALDQSLSKVTATPKERKIAFHLFCKRPMKISREQLRYLLDKDMWNE